MTDGPDDILRGLIEGDTDGPEATVEQEAFVSGLLGSLRRDDPPIPDDVLRRLDAVLAEERRTGARALVALPGGSDDAAEPGAGSAPATLPDNVSVLPTAAERRGPTSRSFRILGGLAAAAVVVVGGSVVLNNGSSGSSSDSAGGGDVEVAALVQDTNTAYSSSALGEQLQPLLRKVPTGVPEGGGSPISAPATPDPGPPTAEVTDTASTPTASGTGSGAGPKSVEPVTPERALLCTREISDGTVATPLLVDQGTYDGKDAEIYVLASIDAPGSYDVFVVAAGCTTGSYELFILQRVTRP